MKVPRSLTQGGKSSHCMVFSESPACFSSLPSSLPSAMLISFRQAVFLLGCWHTVPAQALSCQGYADGDVPQRVGIVFHDVTHSWPVDILPHGTRHTHITLVRSHFDVGCG